MSSGLATRCPACHTVFRVVRDQLKVSGGWVRCGRCSEVFNASLALLDLDTGLPWNPDPGNSAVSGGPASTKPQEGPRARETAPTPAPPTQPPQSPAVAQVPAPPEPAKARAADALAAQEPAYTPPAAAAAPPGSTPGRQAEDPVAPAPVSTRPQAALPPPPEGDEQSNQVTFAHEHDAAAAPSPPLAPEAGTETLSKGWAPQPDGGPDAADGRESERHAPAVGDSPGAAPVAQQPAADSRQGQGSLEEAMSRHANDLDTPPSTRDEPYAEPSSEPFSWRTTPMPAPMPVPPAEPAPADTESRPEDFYTRDTLPFDREQMLQEGAPPYVPPQRPAGLDRRPAPQIWPPLPPAEAELSQPPEMYREAGAGGFQSSGTPDAIDPPSFLRDAERARRWRQPRVRAGLMAAALVASALLTLQVLVTYRDLAAARLPALQPLLQGSCALLGCTVGPALAINSLVVESSGLVRADKPNQYRLQVALRNRAGIPVALPAIDVTLTDTQGAVISRKVLLPTDMGSTIDSLPAGQSLTLQATLQNLAQGSGGEAGVSAIAGYTVEVFYP